MSQTVVDVDLIRRAVTVASRAPSLHNSQPWLWVFDTAKPEPVLELWLDKSRIVRNADAGGREAVISCGAALDHLWVAVAAAGRHAVIERFPNPNRPEHLATVTFRPLTVSAERAAELADAIMARRTDRLPFLAPTDWEVFEPDLHEALTGLEVTLHTVPAELLPELAQASALTDRLRRYDDLYQSELDWWTSPFEFDVGIPRSALNSVGEADRVGVNRSFPASQHRDRRTGVRADHAVVLVLTTPDDTPADALAAGEALSTVLLACTAAGLASCPVTHVTELASAAKVVAELVGTADRPQVLVRVGRAPELERHPTSTPRRDIDDILKFRN